MPRQAPASRQRLSLGINVPANIEKAKSKNSNISMHVAAIMLACMILERNII
jgi:hypothetical protein